MTKPIKTVVILGGGTAGWITAGTLAAAHGAGKGNGLNITLVESPDVKPIGVGEGTWPTMRNTLRKMGISESDLFRDCDASFKQGSKFAKWVDGSESDFYYHPLVLPTGFAEGNLAPYWQTHVSDKSFSDAVCFQEAICEQNLAPKRITNREYEAVANYAYHLNAGKFSELLKKHCVEKLGVNYISDHMLSVNSADNGDIESIQCQAHGAIPGDLFVDCTGFRSLLLGEHYRVPFVDKSDVLFADRAIAAHVPYNSEDEEIVPYTVSTGHAAGWIWDIGLQSRRGTGVVYSSKYMDEQQAKDTLEDYLAPSIGRAKVKELTFRSIPIKPGHREQFWKNNCVAIGLSAGFLEPLEASALVLVELSAKMLSEQIPNCREVMPIIAKRFNETFLYRWDRIIDFLKLHYILNHREEPFWKDNKDPETIPDSLQELLDLWKYQHPWDHDFRSRLEVFPAASYQYVLYGMGFKTESEHIHLSEHDKIFAQRNLTENQRMIEKISAQLPGTRELLNRIGDYGLQKI